MSDRAPVVCSPGYACDLGLHVFPVAKYEGVLAGLRESRHLGPGGPVDPPATTRALLRAAHDDAYLDDLDALRWTPRTQYSEMPLTHDVVTAFARHASGTVEAVRLALARGVAVHVGGGLHHAHAGHAEGFCYFNDLAVAARVALREGLVKRVAIVDLDVHQGNGTAAIFRDDPAVFTLSVHQEHNYPSPKERSTLDVGLDNGTADDAYLAALDRAMERVWAFGPDLVLYQAGADPYEDDQLGGLALTFAGLEARDRRVLDEAARRRVPSVVTLGGGYARRFDDTVHIHTTTCRVALDALAAGARS